MAFFWRPQQETAEPVPPHLSAVKGALWHVTENFSPRLLFCAPSCASLYTVVHTHLLPIAGGGGVSCDQFRFVRSLQNGGICVVQHAALGQGAVNNTRQNDGLIFRGQIWRHFGRGFR